MQVALHIHRWLELERHIPTQEALVQAKGTLQVRRRLQQVQNVGPCIGRDLQDS